MRAAAARAAASRSPSRSTKCSSARARSSACSSSRIRPGPGGQKVRRLLIEEGADIKKELYVGMVVDRGTQRVALMASSEGGMDIEHVAATTPEKIHKVFIDPATGLDRRGSRRRRAQDRHSRGQHRAGAGGAAGTLQGIRRDRRVAGRDQSARDHRRRQSHRARRQAQLRFQRAVPASGDRRDARPRRGGSGGDRGVEVRPVVHLARRQHRLPGQRRRARDGDDGHRSSSTAASRRTSSMSAAARRRRR